METMLSMIAELVRIISSEDGNVEDLTIPNDAFPCARYQDKLSVIEKEYNPDWGTDAFRESIKGNLVRTTSIPRRCCLRQTTLLFPCVAIRGLYDNSSMG